MDALSPLLCLDGCFAVRVAIWSCFVVDVLPPLWFGQTLCRRDSSSPLADALPLGILVLRRRLCNHSDVTSLFAGPVVSVVWVPLVCGLSALFSPYCLLMSMLLLGFLACVCVSSVFLFF